MTELPPGIAALGPEVAERLDAMVRDAHARQRQELADALDQTLRIVPRPLRGVVRKVLTG
jgi:hypothetical protein